MQIIFLETLMKRVSLLYSTRIKIPSPYLNINTVNLMSNCQKTAFFWRFFRPVSGFPSILSERVVGSLSELVKNLRRKIPRPTIYHSSTYLFPFKSLRGTDRQTDRQTHRHPYFINIYKLGKKPVQNSLFLSYHCSFTFPIYHSSSLITRPT